MCLIAVAYRAHPDYRLLLAANRDEFHARPTAPAGFWPDHPDVAGGRDLASGGSWLAFSRGGRLAAVTNVRRMEPVDPWAPSRGHLVRDFVTGQTAAEAFALALQAEGRRYAGFNLLLWDGSTLLHTGNRGARPVTVLEPGVHAVSNADLGTPWPKLRRLEAAMAAVCAGAPLEALWAALADDTPAPDEELPNTGLPREQERFLSPPFIRGEHYGTRASTLLAVPADGHAPWLEERRYGPQGVAAGQTRLTLWP